MTLEGAADITYLLSCLQILDIEICLGLKCIDARVTFKVYSKYISEI